MKPTLQNKVESIMTDFIWLSIVDIEKMLYLDGYSFEQSGLRSAIKSLFKKGKIIRRELLTHRQEYQSRHHQYMRTPK